MQCLPCRLSVPLGTHPGWAQPTPTVQRSSLLIPPIWILYFTTVPDIYQRTKETVYQAERKPHGWFTASSSSQPVKYCADICHIVTKKGFQYDAYRPLAKRTCFGGHQMSVPVWRGLCIEVPCIMGNGHMETHTAEQHDGQIRLKILPSRNSVIGR